MSEPSSEVIHIRLGTRASQLAMWQSNWVKSQLELAGATVELVPVKTQGDVRTGPLAQIGGQGLFTKQLQIALLDGEIDLAVHSLKDLPTEDVEGLVIAAIPPRETTADALVSPGGLDVRSLPANSIVGTGSVRRAAQLLHLRDDLQIRDIRGNVDTRLAKLDAGEFDAIVLASAGLTRLGLADRIGYEFSPPELLPAIGQGALGLETRADDSATVGIVSKLNHRASFAAAMAERSLLRTLFAGCLSPVGAVTEVNGDRLSLTGVVLSRDGRTRILSDGSGDLDHFVQLGLDVADDLKSRGADKLLERHD